MGSQRIGNDWVTNTFTFSSYVLRLIFTSAWGKSFRFPCMKQLKFGIRSCDEKKKKIFLFFFKIWKNELNRNYWISIFSYNYLSGWKILLCFFRVIVRDHVNELYKLMVFLHLHLVFKRNNQAWWISLFSNECIDFYVGSKYLSFIV